MWIGASGQKTERYKTIRDVSNAGVVKSRDWHRWISSSEEKSKQTVPKRVQLFKIRSWNR